MRYLIRRPDPTDLSEIKKRVSTLDSELGAPAENYRRTVSVEFSPLRSAHYHLTTRKVGESWVWVCPGIELDAENEEGLFELTDQFGVPRPSHLVGRDQPRIS